MVAPNPSQLQLRCPGRSSFPRARSGDWGWIQVWGQWGAGGPHFGAGCGFPFPGGLEELLPVPPLGPSPMSWSR